MRPHITKLFWGCLASALLLGAMGCQRAAPSPEMQESLTPTLTPSSTPTPTITQTTTPAYTITPFPSLTATITPTPYRILSQTPLPSQVPLQPASLFPYEDVNGRTIDWSYIYITQIGRNDFDEVNDLWAFMAFQLLDRAIHQRHYQFLGEIMTVYYLNVAHEFNGELLPMQLVLGGSAGENVPIDAIPAGGTSYIQVQVRDSLETFDPRGTHRDANRAFEFRESAYPLLFLKDLQELLPTLSTELILLANHPILFPRNDWPQIKLDMRRVNYLAARYQPFFELDAYDRLVDQSSFAYLLRDHILEQQDMPEGFYAFSSQTLILIQGEE